MDEVTHETVKAFIEVAIEKILNAMKVATNTARAPTLKKRLTIALRDLLRIDPDERMVERVIAQAELYGYRGEELGIAKERLEIVRTSKRGGGVSGKKPSIKRAFKKKVSKKKTSKKTSRKVSKKASKKVAKKSAKMRR